MQARRLMVISFLGMFLLISSVKAQDATPTLPAHEAVSIPLLQGDPNGRGSDVFWSPDSHYVVVANAAFSSTEAVSRGTQYGVFSLPDGQFLFSFGGFVDWMPDSKHIIMHDVDMADTQIWDVPSGQVTMTLKGAQNGWLWNVERSQAASETANHSLQIYDLASGAILQTLPNVVIKDALWSHDGRLIAVIGSDTRLKVYDVKTGTLIGYVSGYRALSWRPDDHQLVITLPQINAPTQLGIWTFESGKIQLFDSLNTSNLWSPDGKKFAFASTDQSVQIVDVSTGQLTRKIEGFESRISLYRWDKPERLIVITGDYGAGIELAFEAFNLETGQRTLQTYFDITATARIIDDRFEIIQGECLYLCKQVYDLNTGHQLSDMKITTTELSAFVLVSPDYQWIVNMVWPDLANSATDYHVHLYNVDIGAEVANFSVNEDSISYVRWSPDSRYFAVLGEKAVRIYTV